MVENRWKNKAHKNVFAFGILLEFGVREHFVKYFSNLS